MTESVCEKDKCNYCEAMLYAGLSKPEVEEVRALLTQCTGEPRAVLFSAGDPSTFLLLIREGQVKLTAPDIKGREHVIGLVGPGYFLGFDTFGVPQHSYTAESLTPTVFCRIDHHDLMALLQRNPKVSINVLRALNEQLAQARMLIRAVGQKTSVEKIASLLLDLLPGPQAALNLSRQEIAEILGLRVETVSRIMAQLRREGVVDTARRRTTIRKRARLRLLGGRIFRLTSTADAEPLPRRRRAATEKRAR